MQVIFHENEAMTEMREKEMVEDRERTSQDEIETRPTEREAGNELAIGRLVTDTRMIAH